MKLGKMIAVLLLLTLAASLTAFAQDHTVVFTLKQDTYWGAANLPAGQYYVRLSSDATAKVLINAVDGRSAAILVPVSREYSNRCDNSSLTLTATGGNYAVTRVCFAETQQAYFFQNLAPKGEKIAEVKSFGGSK